MIPSAPPNQTSRTWLLRKDHTSVLHPLSGTLILLLDWLLFGTNLLSGLTASVPVSLVGFILGTLCLLLVQRNLVEEGRLKSLLKALVGGTLVGLPFPIGGTLAGAAVIAMAGLKGRGVERLHTKKLAKDNSNKR